MQEISRYAFIVPSSHSAILGRHANHDRYRRVVSSDERRGQHPGADRGVAGPFWPRSPHDHPPRFSERRLPDIPGNPPVSAALQKGETAHFRILAAGGAHRDRRTPSLEPQALLPEVRPALSHLFSHPLSATSPGTLS